MAVPPSCSTSPESLRVRLMNFDEKLTAKNGFPSSNPTFSNWNGQCLLTLEMSFFEQCRFAVVQKSSRKMSFDFICACILNRKSRHLIQTCWRVPRWAYIQNKYVNFVAHCETWYVKIVDYFIGDVSGRNDSCRDNNEFEAHQLDIWNGLDSNGVFLISHLLHISVLSVYQQLLQLEFGHLQEEYNICVAGCWTYNHQHVIAQFVETLHVSIYAELVHGC